MSQIVWHGTITDGQGICSQRNHMPYGWIQGSLNLLPEADGSLRNRIKEHRPPGWEQVDWLACIFPATLEDGQPVIVGLHAEGNHHEIAATVNIRKTYNLKNGDSLAILIDRNLFL
jgi:CTP-dependent riboflavin kinase